MIALVIRLLDYVGGLMSKNLHNYSVASLLVLEWVVVMAVLVFPDSTRLEIAKDVGVVLLGALGIVGGVHGMKAIKGVESGSRPNGEP
jgi:hypothetical protein